MLRFFRISPGRLGARRRQHVEGRGGSGDPRVQPRADDAAGGNALLILAARHPERFAEVERLCRREGLSTIRRSELPIDAEPRADAVILDTIGELAQLYQIATAVFVGGSLVPAGGHNILEPAVHGKPIVFGPHMENFAEIAETFLANGAAIQVRTDRELEDAVVSLMGDPVRRARLGAAARALVEANRGAKDKTLTVIAELLPPPDGPRARSSARSAWSIERSQRRLRPRGPSAPLVVRAASARAAPPRSSRSSASAISSSAAAARRRSSRRSRGCCASWASARRF